MLRVSFRTEGGGVFQIFLQQAETVRLAAAADGGTPVTSLVVGDSIMVHCSAQGTHVGAPISVSVEER